MCILGADAPIKGELFCSITLRWNYATRSVNLSNPEHIQDALDKFHHELPSKAEHTAHVCIMSWYSRGPQMFPLPDEAPTLPKDQKTHIQKLLRTLLFYTRAVDPTMLLALNAIATQQENPTTKTATVVVQLLSYCVTCPNVIIRYHASNMTLHIHSDASYLSLP
eukprot:8507805-Ditylum_brightwellii.AAC.1